MGCAQCKERGMPPRAGLPAAMPVRTASGRSGQPGAGGEHQDGGCGWCSARGCPALRQPPNPRLPRRQGCFAMRSAREIHGCLCVSAVNTVSAWCLPARESTCLRASLARDTTSNGEEVVSGAEAASSAGRRKCRAASAARRRRLRDCEMIRRMYLANPRRRSRVPPPTSNSCR